MNVTGSVRFMDSEAHPRDMNARIAELPPGEDAVDSVRICRGAWIRQKACILKGVTVCERAMVGVGSVVRPLRVAPYRRNGRAGPRRRQEPAPVSVVNWAC